MDPAALFDTPLFVQIAFHPRAITQGATSLSPEAIIDGQLDLGDVKLGYRIYPHPDKRESAPVVIYFHGNAEVAADYDDTCKDFHKSGATLMVIDFRGYGWSTGQPAISTLADDGIRAAARIPAVLGAAGMSRCHIILFGRSIGSVCAIAAAAKPPEGFRPDGLVIESGLARLLELPLVTNLAAMMMPMLGVALSDLPDPFDNASAIKEVDLPLLVLHGEEDDICPVRDGQILFDACGTSKDDKTIVLFPGGGHNDLTLLHHVQYFDAVSAFVDFVVARADAGVTKPAPGFESGPAHHEDSAAAGAGAPPSGSGGGAGGTSGSEPSSEPATEPSA